MALTYLILNVCMLVWAVLLFVKKWHLPSKTWWITLAAMATLTLVFDSLAIHLGFFHYNQANILGITLGLAPIEDFFYALVAVIIVPALWKRFAPAKEHHE